jgi:hypothetical protein
MTFTENAIPFLTGRADMHRAAGACLLNEGAHGGNMVSPVKRASRRRAK